MKSLIIGLALVAAPVAAGAAAPDAGDPAAQLVETLETDRVMENIFSDLAPLFGAQVVAQLSSQAETRAMIDRFVTQGRGGRERLQAILAEEFLNGIRGRFPEVKAEIAEAYRANLTEAELVELNRFFSRGVGAKYLAMAPEVQKHLETLGQRIGMEVGARALPRALERAETEMMQ